MSIMWWWSLLKLLLISQLTAAAEKSQVDDAFSPSLHFVSELHSKLSFANGTGKKIKCEAEGSNSPVNITWVFIDGTTVEDVPGLRKVNDGSLELYTFTADKFRPDIHSTVYRCLASSTAGVIRSVDMLVNGVIAQNYDAQVYDVYVIEGNVAVMKCHIPTVIGDYVKTVAWIKNNNLLIEPTSDLNEKYAIINPGFLHIRNASVSETGSNYKCKTVNLLNGETKISPTGGHLFVTESQGNINPKIASTMSSFQVTSGDRAVIPCVGQGRPAPNLKWFKKRSNGQIEDFLENIKMRATQSSLIIEKVDISDAGIYVCELYNVNGRSQHDFSLSVYEKLSIVITPKVQVAKTDETVTFKCTVTGNYDFSILWFFNGNLVKTSSEDSLTVSATVSAQGFYQCFVKNDNAMVQATAELRLSEISPYFEYVFEHINAKPGETINVTCIASGVPLPTITWTKDDSILKNGQKFQIGSYKSQDGKVVAWLKLSKVAVEDGGVYSCVATNDAGESSHSVRIGVKGPLKAKPSIKVMAIAGKNAYLNCPAYGNPIEETTWTDVDNRSLAFKSQYETFPNGTLWIRDLHRPTNSGRYFCTVRNSLNQEATSSVEVDIVVPPKVVPFEFQDDLLREGMRARLQCVIGEGDSPINITWLKDGKSITNDLGIIVRVLDEFSSILTINNILPKHNGKYTCLATNRAAAATHSAVLSVNVPPKIVPFAFQEEQLIEGMLARISCIVSRGDLPLNIYWEKDGMKSNLQEMDVSIHSLDEYSSILSIANLSTKHNGMYTCHVKNAAGNASLDASLFVQVPPRWLTQPKEIILTTTGTRVIIDCLAEGYPKPTVEWKFLKRESTTRSAISDNHRMQISTNGSLIIYSVSTENEGHYICKTTNGVGRPLEAVVQIKINAPPYFTPSLQDMKAVVGKNVQWHCVVHGDKPIDIKWLHYGKPINYLSNDRISVQMLNHTQHAESTLTIHKITRDDSGQYQCVANNSYGSNVSVSSLTVFEPPESPVDLHVLSHTSTSIEFDWKIKFDGNDAIKKFIIQYKNDSISWNDAINMETINGEPTNSIIAHLRPSTVYNFRVYAENTVGRSIASQTLTAKTDEDVPAAAPLDVQIIPLDAETFKVEWLAPAEELWNGKLLGFSVGFKDAELDEPFTFKTLLTPDPRVKPLSVILSGLKQFTKYSVVVQAYTSKGKGPMSDSVIAMTSEGAPTSPPTDVRCTTLSSRNIYVTWDPPPPSTINGILHGYKIFYNALAEDLIDDYETFHNKTLSSSFTLTGLEKFTNYSIQVLAMTRSAEGPSSFSIYCSTLDDVPDAIAEVKAAASSSSSVVVSWKSPEKSNGVVQFYKIYWRESESKHTSVRTVGSNTYSYEFAVLKNATFYEFWLTSSTAAGESPPSQVLKQNTMGPAIPAKIVSFGKPIAIGWKRDILLDCNAVGFPVPYRSWTANGKIIDNSNKFSMTSDGNLEIKNIDEQDSGNYKCDVMNDKGKDSITYSVTVLAPPVSMVVDVTAVTSSSVAISWKNISTKRSKVKGYIIQWRKESIDWKEITVEAELQNYKFDGLDCGSRYEIMMAAFNRIGTGSPSEVAYVSTNGSVPAPPVKSDLIEESTNSVSMYLNTWKSNGCPIQYFTVEYAPRSSNEWTLVSDDVKPIQRRLVVPNLKSGTWYGLRMKAFNSAGSTVAEYDFATLTNVGATISPEFQSDSASEEMDSLMSYLNFYLIVPVVCTVIVLLAILGAACFYIKMKKRELNRARVLDNQMSVAGTLRPGARSGSFSYIQRRHLGTTERSHAGTEDELAPYATFQLGSNLMDATMGRRVKTSIPPPPPPRFEGFPGSGLQELPPPTSASQNVGPIETTFFFSHLKSDDHVQPPSGLHHPHPINYPAQNNDLLIN